MQLCLEFVVFFFETVLIIPPILNAPQTFSLEQINWIILFKVAHGIMYLHILYIVVCLGLGSEDANQRARQELPQPSIFDRVTVAFYGILFSCGLPLHLFRTQHPLHANKKLWNKFVYKNFEKKSIKEKLGDKLVRTNSYTTNLDDKLVHTNSYTTNLCDRLVHTNSYATKYSKSAGGSPHVHVRRFLTMSPTQQIQLSRDVILLNSLMGDPALSNTNRD